MSETILNPPPVVTAPIEAPVVPVITEGLDTATAAFMQTLNVNPNPGAEVVPPQTERQVQTPPAVEQPQNIATPPVTPPSNVDALKQATIFSDLSTVLGKEIKSVDEVKAILEETAKPKERQFKSEFLKKAVEYAENSSNPDEALGLFLKTQSTDYTKLAVENPKDAIAAKMREAESYLSKEEIEAMIDEKYSTVDTEGLEGRELELANRKNLAVQAEIKRDASQAAEYLNKLKVERSKPDLVVQNEQKQRAESERLQKWNEGFLETLKNSGEISIEGYKHAIVLQDEKGQLTPTARQMARVAQNPESFMELFKDEQGNYSAAAMIQTVYVMNNLPQLLKSASGVAAGAAVTQVMDKIENPSLQTPQNPQTPPSTSEQNPALIALEEARKRGFA